MKNAKTMFEELGFELYFLSESYLLYKFETDYEKVYVNFDLKQNSYEKTKYSTKYGNYAFCPVIKVDIKLHNAIHQQMVELGWIE